MLVLTVDTTTSYVVAGLVRFLGGDATAQPVAQVIHDEPRGHMELLTPSIMSCLGECGLAPADVDAVVVGEGPGPFTGLRVGMATAAAFGEALGIPVHGVTSLEAAAYGAAVGASAGDVIAVITDARRREWYYTAYEVRADGALEPLLEPAVAAPADVVAALEEIQPAGGLTVLAAKSVAGPVREAVEPREGWELRSDDAWPQPVGLATAAARKAGGSDKLTASSAPLKAQYLRRPDAVEPKRKPASSAVDFSSVTDAPETGEVRVVRLGVDAAPRLTEIEAELFAGDSPWPLQGFVWELSRDNTIYVGLETAGGELVGYAGIAKNGADDDPEWEIHTVGITPAHQGKGWSKKLIEPLIAEVDSVGGPVFLEVRTDNAPAIGLYESYGFEITGTRKGYYQPSGADAHTMMRPAHEVAEGTVIVGVETSCDETGVGVVQLRADGSVVTIANEVASSMDQHARFGGVVPEIASRAHLESMVPTMGAARARMRRALAGRDKPDAVAATVGPGLAGALLVGAAAAKAYAAAWEVPFYGVNHLGGHVAVEALDTGSAEGMENAIALLVSGGHTQILHVQGLGKPMEEIGSTLDDAAGEAYDKVARLLGLSYPGGPVIDRLAAKGNPKAIAFPRGMMRQQDSRYDFSFSGLKTAVARYVEQAERDNTTVAVEDICASFQEAVVDVLTAKALRACEDYGAGVLLLGGGVSANKRLRELAAQRCAAAGVELRIPPAPLCTDNGVMIAALAAQLIHSGASPSGLAAATDPSLEVDIPVVAPE
ncbi:MAG TPA: tRNA (adenosine(37)-N6)-threonylcarbamoyltransferase complex transferase subunit TsaD [Candidatus Corynebacterium gallistercoris]|uniref:tRNA N6-adenosine threonylcarbamoyltransferase n=1 Tax=Candidatus Corynebacterium gallistercoris TaxID=2838530 RepID=A0A9D1URY3_9CORY|nr:tRNA (adenosine(37)-N6)-threonylcarbamoyltransferase complex transferase subunit TsaD [Candidatus Corynebacterium gallistercoris]